MVSRIETVSFSGVEVQSVDVQIHVGGGLPAFNVVGLADKAVAESRERVRSALSALGLAMPAKRITVNLAPADLQKEGSHYDLPIALGLMTAMGVIPQDEIDGYVALGELSLDGRLSPVTGVLPAAIHAQERDKGLICPAKNGPEAGWAGDLDILAASDLIQIVNHIKGDQLLARPETALEDIDPHRLDLADVKGQETAKKALEVAAAGGHALLMIGPPGSGKSMLAARLSGILPPLDPKEALEVSMIHSMAGTLDEGRLKRHRPYRDPHHSASLPALIGGGMRARPGEVSLAHRGVLFLDELPEFARPTLESLRQPLEIRKAVISRANNHVTYPAHFQLVAAMNPCRCGYLGDPERSCTKAPRCGQDYQSKISGPLFDRIDITVEVPAVGAADLTLPPPSEGSAAVAARVQAARDRQQRRYQSLAPGQGILTNAEADGTVLEEAASPDTQGLALLREATEKLNLTARGYHRVLRVARTLADLQGAETVGRLHVAEALSYRRVAPGR